MGLRERNRHNTLVVTQRTAIAMFVEHGFDEVKVTDIAAEVDIAPSTLYRHFPTKESIVVWDEHDDEYGPAIARALQDRSPFAALRSAFVAVFAERYDTDTDFQLLRAQLMSDVPSIYAASAADDAETQEQLAHLIAPHLGDHDLATARLLAGAALLASYWAFDRWQAESATRPLAQLVDEAFDRMSHLAAVR